jgi:type IV pilus assembly protein PilQ
LETTRQVQELAPLQTEHIRIRYARAKDFFKLFSPTGAGGGAGGSGPAGGGAKGKGGILSERGSVIVDDRTNSLLITETAQKLEEFRRIVKLLDVPIRQVLIEARLVVANSDFSKSVGVKWGASGIVGVNNNPLYYGGSKDSVGNAINSNATNAAGIIAGTSPVTIPDALSVNMGATSPTSSFALGYVSNDVRLELELSAAESQGRGEVVSQPKVITGDKQQATIKSGTEIPYQESASNGETTVSFKEAVLKLDVTPSITPDDRIIMDLVINQDSVGKNVSTGNGGSVPSIDTNAIKTQVLVGNGETVVLGGVFKSSDVTVNTKVPFLGDLPYVGRLFSSKDTIKTKSELLIFITPRILADSLID